MLLIICYNSNYLQIIFSISNIFYYNYLLAANHILFSIVVIILVLYCSKIRLIKYEIISRYFNNCYINLIIIINTNNILHILTISNIINST